MLSPLDKESKPGPGDRSLPAPGLLRVRPLDRLSPFRSHNCTSTRREWQKSAPLHLRDFLENLTPSTFTQSTRSLSLWALSIASLAAMTLAVVITSTRSFMWALQVIFPRASMTITKILVLGGTTRIASASTQTTAKFRDLQRRPISSTSTTLRVTDDSSGCQISDVSPLGGAAEI